MVQARWTIKINSTDNRTFTDSQGLSLVLTSLLVIIKVELQLMSYNCLFMVIPLNVIMQSTFNRKIGNRESCSYTYLIMVSPFSVLIFKSQIGSVVQCVQYDTSLNSVQLKL